MSTAVGWGLAALAVGTGYAQWGWPGVALALTLIAFWLLLQFSQTLRVMRNAGAAPVGHIDSAVMLHAKLQRGMRMIEILPLARSLGQKVAGDPEAYEWHDASGASVRVEFARGRCAGWRLSRPGE